MPPPKAASAAEDIKKYEKFTSRKLDALTRAVERELRVRPVWDPLKQFG